MPVGLGRDKALWFLSPTAPRQGSSREQAWSYHVASRQNGKGSLQPP
jgi:hypothetical protein